MGLQNHFLSSLVDTFNFFLQNGNTIAGNKTTPRVSVQDKTDRFEVDPAALQSIINGVSPMVVRA